MHLGVGHRTSDWSSCMCRAPVTSMLISGQLKCCFATCCFPALPAPSPYRTERPALST